MKRFAALVGALVLSGCEKPGVAGGPEPVGSPSAIASAAPPSRPAPSVDQWRAAIGATYTVKDEKSDGQGITEFLACFSDQDAKCPPFFKGQRDAFRKVTFFEPALSMWNESEYNPGAHVTPYVSVRDCADPSVILRASYRASTWLFMEKVAFLVDGEILLEHAFAHEKVNRDTVRGGVYESADWRLEPDQQAQLPKLVAAKSVAIRLTGSKGFANLVAKESKDVVMDVGRVLRAVSRMSQATAELGGRCTASK